MTSAALTGLLLRQPFQPFRFVLGDNTELCVERASQVRHEPGNRIVVVMGFEGREFLIDLDRVARGVNGRSRDQARFPVLPTTKPEAGVDPGA
jgi:hypothetical protein